MGRPRHARRLGLAWLAALAAASGWCAPAAAAGAAGPTAPGTACQLAALDDRCEHWWSVYNDGDATFPLLGQSPVEDGSATNREYPVDIAVSPGGERVFTAGNSYPPVEGRVARLWLTAADTTTGQRVWSITLAGATVLDIAPSVDGGHLFVTGVDGGSGMITVAYDAATGTQLWSARYAPADSDRSAGVALTASPDGERIFVAGRSRRLNDGYDWVTVAYDTVSGRELSVARYVTPYAVGNPDRADRPTAIAVSPDAATVYVAGYSRGANAKSTVDYDIATVAYDVESAGQLWAVRSDGVGERRSDGANDMALSPDGARVYVAANIKVGRPGGGESSSFYTLAYDAGSGAKLWEHRYDGAAGQSARGPRAIAVTATDTVVVAGYDTAPTAGDYLDYFTFALDGPTGTQRWSGRYAVSGFDYETANAAVASPDGSQVYVTGTSAAPYGQDLHGDVATVAYDVASGAQRWAARFHWDAAQNGFDEGVAVAASFDGRGVFVADQADTEAPSETNNAVDAITLAYPGSGTPGVRRPFVPRPRKTINEDPGQPSAPSSGAGPSPSPSPPRPGRPPVAADPCAPARRAAARARAAVRKARTALRRARRAAKRVRGGRLTVQRRQRSLRRRTAELRRADKLVKRRCKRARRR